MLHREFVSSDHVEHGQKVWLERTVRYVSRVVTSTSADPPLTSESGQRNQQLPVCQSNSLVSDNLAVEQKTSLSVADTCWNEASNHCGWNFRIMNTCEFAYFCEHRWLPSNVSAINHCLLLHRALDTSMVVLITDITQAEAVIPVHIDQPMPYQQASFAARRKAKYI